ncbi:MAG: hypothetical protein ACPG5B_02735 [Chitinophagales bacterium]
MKKAKKGISLLLLLCVSQIIFGQQTDWQHLKTAVYEIDYPSDWVLNQEGFMGTEFIIFSPTTSKKDKFQENISLIRQNLGSAMTLEQYVELSENQIIEMMDNSKLLESNRIKQNGLDFHELKYHGSQGKSKLTFWQFFTIIDEEAYILTFTAAKKEFKTYEKVAKKIIASFELHEEAVSEQEEIVDTTILVDEAATEGWKQVTAADYTFKFPFDWVVDKSGQMGMDLIVFSKVSSENDVFKENVNLIVQDLSNIDIDFEGYVELSNNQVKNILKNSKVMKNERIERDGLIFQEVIYSGKQNNYQLIFHQLYTIFDKKAYVLTFTGEEKAFADYKEIAAEIMDSFVLKKK